MRSARTSRSARRDETPVGVTPLRSRPEFDRLFDALADIDRLRILEQLERFPSTAGKLASKLGWTRDATAKQLKLLERAGLLRGERVRRRVDYARVSPALMAALHWSSVLWVRLPKMERPDSDDLERQAALAAALRTPGRRGMLECMCRGGPITQGAAAEDCGISQGLASRGLTQLVEVGLVRVKSARPPRLYVATPETMAEVVRWLHGQVLIAKAAEAQQRALQEARAAWAAGRAGRINLATF